MKTLDAFGISASFFFTGDFYRNPKFKTFIEEARDKGHYLGAHSDKHLLYNDWTSEKKLLVSRDSFSIDLRDNYAEMMKFGIKKDQAPYYLPPYEWNDASITQWTRLEGLNMINMTHGTLTHTDYTGLDDSNYRNNAQILQSVYDHEEKKGLNGFILLSHVGVKESRPDKFYNELEGMIGELKKRGYDFVSLEEMLDTNP